MHKNLLRLSICQSSCRRQGCGVLTELFYTRKRAGRKNAQQSATRIEQGILQTGSFSYVERPSAIQPALYAFAVSENWMEKYIPLAGNVTTPAVCCTSDLCTTTGSPTACVDIIRNSRHKSVVNHGSPSSTVSNIPHKIFSE